MTNDLDDCISSVAGLHRLATALGAGQERSAGMEATDAESLPTSPDLVIALTEAFALILFECRGALDYAEEANTHLLANRVVDAVGKTLGRF